MRTNGNEQAFNVWLNWGKDCVMRYFEPLRDFRWHYLGRRSRRVVDCSPHYPAPPSAEPLREAALASRAVFLLLARCRLEPWPDANRDTIHGLVQPVDDVLGSRVSRKSGLRSAVDGS